MRTLVRAKPGPSSMLTLSKDGAAKRIVGLREKPKPSRGMPAKVSSFLLAFAS